MGNSWGHAVRPLTEAEIADWRRSAEKWPPGYPCAAPKCNETPTHATSYNYVTGRAGRISWAERKVCTGHAEKFAAKYKIEITAAPAPVHAMQQMLAAGGLGRDD